MAPPPETAAGGAAGAGAARILDAGYRRYDGTRLGVGHAVRSVIANTLRRILGLRRPARSKLLPMLAIAMAYVPAIVFVGVVALFNRFGNDADARQLIPDYPDYYGFIVSAIALFVTFVAPEALCPDRRSRVLSLYLSSQLTRMTYLLGKAVAIATVIATVTLGPPLLLLLGLAIQGAGPHGFLGFLGVLGRILASGAVMAAIYTAVSLAIASLTDRRAIAAAATLLVLLGTHIVAGTLRFGLGGPDWTLTLSLILGPALVVNRIFGGTGDFPEVSTIAIVIGVSSWTVLGAAIAVMRYRRLVVTR